jgi:mono/diheme cytochrome c family protein
MQSGPFKEIVMHRAMGFAVAGLLLLGGAAHAQDKKTERLWKAKCASCHGADGKAQTENGKKQKVADYTAKEWQAAKNDADLKKAILEGVKKEKDGVKQEMDGYSDALKPGEADALVAYIRALAK